MRAAISPATARSPAPTATAELSVGSVIAPPQLPLLGMTMDRNGITGPALPPEKPAAAGGATCAQRLPGRVPVFSAAWAEGVTAAQRVTVMAGKIPGMGVGRERRRHRRTYAVLSWCPRQAHDLPRCPRTAEYFACVTSGISPMITLEARVSRGDFCEPR